MKRIVKTLLSSCCLVAGLSGSASASSHMDAPLVTLDPAANTTDVYAFLTDRDGAEYLTTALSAYPHEMPGVGPNVYNFDDDVLYQIHIALADDVAAGNATLSYEFHFSTNYAADTTILPSYLGVIEDVGDSAQNLLQTYAVVCVDHRTGSRTVLGEDLMVHPQQSGRCYTKVQCR